jgi:hypothetical protein
MSRLLLTEQLIADVRSVLDETNRSRIKDDIDIIPALNRGLDHGASLLSRHYDDPLLKLKTVTTTSDIYPVPDDAFEARVVRIELERDSGFYEIDRINTDKMGLFESSYTANALTLAWAQVGNDIRLFPGKAGVTIRIHYLKSPAPLGRTMGRVSRIGADFLVIDSLSDQVTTNSDLETSYVNVVNPHSGEVRGCLQVKKVSGNRVEFKSTPDKTEFLGQEVLTLATIGVVEEDRLALAGSTCTPFMPRPFSNFLIAYAEGEIRRKLGEDNDMQIRATKELRNDVERSWVNRENTMRIDTRSDQRNRTYRRRRR